MSKIHPPAEVTAVLLCLSLVWSIFFIPTLGLDLTDLQGTNCGLVFFASFFDMFALFLLVLVLKIKGKFRPILGCGVICVLIVGLGSSLIMLYSSISGQWLLCDAASHYCGDVFGQTGGRFVSLLIGFPVAVFGLYSIAIVTARVRNERFDSPWYNKLIVFLSIVDDMVVAIYVFWFAAWICGTECGH